MSNIKIAEYNFEFRDLTWLDELDASSFVEILSRVTTNISKGDKKVDISQKGVFQALMSLPRYVREQMWVVYQAQLPKDRNWEVHEEPWTPPEPSQVEVQELVEEPQGE